MTGAPKGLSVGTRKRKSQSAAPSAKHLPQKETCVDESDLTDPHADSDLSTWSIEFRRLEQVFRSLNTVYTFCCTRKHFATTFENLKSSVENLTQRFSHEKMFEVLIEMY
jgi:hypothetical protein